MTTMEMVKSGYEAGIVILCESPHDDGVVCKIGDNWFYFGGATAEESTVEEYKRYVPTEDIVREIHSVLDDFNNERETFGDEYDYYEFYLREHGITD